MLVYYGRQIPSPMSKIYVKSLKDKKLISKQSLPHLSSPIVSIISVLQYPALTAKLRLEGEFRVVSGLRRHVKK